MRSEKDQITAGKEKSVVEIQFRDIPREQENTSGNPKQKEEKKEVFTKVGSRGFQPCRIVYAAWKGGAVMEETRRDRFSTADSDESLRQWIHDNPVDSLTYSLLSAYMSRLSLISFHVTTLLVGI